MLRYRAPLDPECPEVARYHAETAGDPIMAMSGCADEFAEDFARTHRARCPRCQEYGAANIGIEHSPR